VRVRAATGADADAIWAILEPIIREGETLTLPRDMSREDALAYWCAPAHEVSVAERDGVVLGVSYLRANQQGPGAHVANAGYATAPQARGQGVARALLLHSLERAKARGFRAMQFNIVISTNERAVKTWVAHGFEVVGRLPGAFEHPRLGFVDALVMYRAL
jgi:ribosomal protein S18 acetylase RimI-like enzyme